MKASWLCSQFQLKLGFTKGEQYKFFWLKEWESERELSLELDKWVEYYNMNYLHSTHGYRTPIQAEDVYYKNHDSQLNAA